LSTPTSVSQIPSKAQWSSSIHRYVYTIETDPSHLLSQTPTIFRLFLRRAIWRKYCRHKLAWVKQLLKLNFRQVFIEMSTLRPIRAI
jgi:hypothetical protein